ncbi:MAG: hypothetical protein HZA35_02380 [Parcubacteria group bacterium]|nr:hypothetical protein [Parcubacteria group bacterium]
MGTPSTNILTIDRSQPFNSEPFFDNWWSFWKGPIDGNGLEGDEEQDQRSLTITELDLNKIRLVTMFNGKTRMSGEESLVLLKASGVIRLDAKVFKTLLENQSHIPKEWWKKTNGLTTSIFFDGTVFRGSRGTCWTLCLCLSGGECGWGYGGIGYSRSVDDLSAVYVNS